MLQRAERQELTAFLYGHIEYSDVFDKKRHTNFCYLWLPGGSALCERYNEIDPDE
jgi:hypothetical protein